MRRFQHIDEMVETKAGLATFYCVSVHVQPDRIDVVSSISRRETNSLKVPGGMEFGMSSETHVDNLVALSSFPSSAGSEGTTKSVSFSKHKWKIQYSTHDFPNSI